MDTYWQQDGNKIYQGHVLDILRDLPDESIHCCITSPPYWGLRSYGTPAQIWDAGDMANCEHVWGDETVKMYAPKRDHNGAKDFGDTRGTEPARAGFKTSLGQGRFCTSCNAWRGSLGLEPTPELYIQHMVQIFKEVRRVLRKDGILFLNLGDSYASGGRGNGASEFCKQRTNEGSLGFGVKKAPCGYKPKDLIGIPWMLAFALRNDGWWLRSAMPWVKRSAMPESCSDRPASALEYVFQFTKSQKYYFDMDAIRIPHKNLSIERWRNGGENTTNTKYQKDGLYMGVGGLRNGSNPLHEGGRNFRNTDLFYQSIEQPHGMIFCGDEPVGLDVNPEAMKAAHFATFAQKLVTPLVLSSTSEKGCCPGCGKPWARVVEKNSPKNKEQWPTSWGSRGFIGEKHIGSHTHNSTESKTIGWKPGCKCYGTEPLPEYPKQIKNYEYKTIGIPGKGDNRGRRPGAMNDDSIVLKEESDEDYKSRIEPIRTERLRCLKSWKSLPIIQCTVLDPFFGSATTGIVSYKHNCKFIGIELSLEYLKNIAIPRIESETKQLKLF